MKTKLTQTFRIPSYDTDKSTRLKPAAFLNYAQDMAGEHAEILGFGDTVLKPRDIVWVISRMHTEFYKLPLWRDTINITTWHRGLDGPFYVREFLIHSEAGELIGRATTSWILFNLGERKMVRVDDIGTDTESINDESMMPACGRLRIPRDLEMAPAGEHTVSYSDIDKNGHANNVMYTVWAMDLLDRDFLFDNPVREHEINFISEAHPGDTVQLYKGCKTTEDGALQWYVRGMVGETESFIVRLTF